MADSPAVLAIFAHPDDIEFRAAGTMLALKAVGFELHYLNVSSGNCGSVTMGPEETMRVRTAEAQAAAKIIGAKWYPSLAHDLEICYEVPLLRQIAAVVREVNPSIVLTHALEDYMEDHMITARLAVTATFAKAIPNFVTDPVRAAVRGDVALYHAMPHGLKDPLRRPVSPEAVVDVSEVYAQKREALAAHQSQKAWLDESQGMDSYLVAMDDEARALAQLCEGAEFDFGEGWIRHLHLGMSGRDEDLLANAVGGLYYPGT